MADLIKQKLQNDPRLAKAQQLLKEALLEYQNQITGIKQGDPQLKLAYDRFIKQISELRGGKLYYPYLSSGLGKGALVELADGSVKYDFITGIGTHYFGHSHPGLLMASVEAALEDTIIQGNLQQSVKALEILEMFVKAACLKGAKLKHCFLTSSGAMANENALKIIFQKKHPAKRLLAFRRNFAGRTMVMCQITDKPENKEGLPKVLDVDYIPFFDPEKPKESTQEAVTCLLKYLKHHPQDYAGMMFELIQGEGGYYPGDRQFFIAIMDILKKNNIAIFVDEIQTFGRTAELFAFQHFGLDEFMEVVTIGKLTQVCATLFTKEYLSKPGFISQTFTTSTSALYASQVILNEILNEGYLGENGKIMRLSKYFTEKLEKISQRHPDWMKGPFGLGAMIGFTPFDGSENLTKQFLQQLYQNGVLSFIAGGHPSRVRFLMPIGTVTTVDIDQVSLIIEQTLGQVANSM